MSGVVFDKIIINNYLSVGRAEVDLREQGFVVVSGRNKESEVTQSNGSGKSTIFDAIFWTLTGETLRGTTNVVNEARKSEGCSCTLDFHSEDHIYTITRYKDSPEKGNSCLFYVDGELISDQVKKTQEVISHTVPSVSRPDILGSIILLGQGLPYKFSSLSPIKRKDALEVMSGSSSEIDKVKYKLDIKESQYRDKLFEVQTEVSKTQGIIIGLESSLEVLKNKSNEFISVEEVETKIKDHQTTIKESQLNQEKLTESIKEKESHITKYTEMIENSENFRIKIKTSLGMIKNQLNSIKSGNCPTCGKPFDISQEVLNQKRILEDKRVSFENQVAQLDSKIADLTAQRANQLSEINFLKESLTSSNYQISRSQEEVTRLENLIKEANDYLFQIKEAEDKISSHKVKVHDLTEELTSLQEYLDCISWIKRQLSRDFKGYMLQEVIKFMSLRSEYYSDYLFTNGKKIEITLSGNKILISVGGRLYENLSGGERQRVDLAIQFSLRDMFVVTSGFSCNLLVLDEAFDNLDAQGSEALVRLVVSEFSDIDSVFVVTHHSEIDIPCDHQITVVKESDGVSHLR